MSAATFFQSAPSARPDAQVSLLTALKARGFETGDFRLDEERVSKLAHLLGVVGGTLRVRCRSTGEERLYATGSGSAWLGAFVMDLGSGHFSRAARSTVRGSLPRSNSALHASSA